MNDNHRKVLALADGVLSSLDISKLTGLQPRYVRKILQRYSAARRAPGARAGAENHQFVSGRRIDRTGYVLVTAPPNHASARPRTNRKTLLISEHRLVMEQTLGRFLLPEEIVDHIDGLTLHNAPENLRVFGSNAEHLRATLAGRNAERSDAGIANMFLRHHQPVAVVPVDTHRQRKESGVLRLRQILLLALKLGVDSPYLLGTNHHTTKAGIDMSSRSTIERAWVDLSAKWGWDHTQSAPTSPRRGIRTDL